MLRRLRNSPELRFAGPVILENTATVFIGLVFSTIIGGISESALAAVGLVNNLINVLVSLAAFLSIGSAALIARLVGEGDPAATSRAVEQSVWMAAVTGIAVTVVCELLSTPILHLLLPGADAQVVDEGLRYFRALCLSFPFLLIMSIVGGALRAAGESTAPMVGAVLMNLVQIAAAYWMISVMGWSVTGAGMAYVVCRAFGMIVVLTACLRSHRHFSVTLRGMLRPSREMGKRIVRLGLPSTLESVSVQVCYLLANSMAMGLGTLEAGVYQVSNTLSAFSTLPQGIFSAISVTFIGQALGENRPEKAAAHRAGGFADHGPDAFAAGAGAGEALHPGRIRARTEREGAVGMAAVRSAGRGHQRQRSHPAHRRRHEDGHGLHRGAGLGCAHSADVAVLLRLDMGRGGRGAGQRDFGDYPRHRGADAHSRRQMAEHEGLKRMPNRELQETVARYSLGDMLVSLRKTRPKQCGWLQQSMPAISEKLWLPRRMSRLVSSILAR